MKVLLSILLILVILIGFSLWTQSYLDKTAEKMLSPLKNVEASITKNDWNTATKNIKLLKNTWESNKHKWEILLDHHEIDMIDMSLSKVVKLVELKDSLQVLPELSELRLLIAHIPDKESLSLSNVL